MKGNHIANAQTVAVREIHSGPIPSPDVMKKYAELSPEIVEKIVNMAITEQQHRIRITEDEQKLKEKAMVTNATIVKCGIVASVFCVLAIMTSAVLCAYFGHPIASGVIGTGGVGVIVTVFVCGAKIKK